MARQEKYRYIGAAEAARYGAIEALYVP